MLTGVGKLVKVSNNGEDAVRENVLFYANDSLFYRQTCFIFIINAFFLIEVDMIFNN